MAASFVFLFFVLIWGGTVDSVCKNQRLLHGVVWVSNALSLKERSKDEQAH